MFCRKCGGKLTDGATFCADCGWPVSGVPLPGKGGSGAAGTVVLIIVAGFSFVVVIGIMAAIAIPKFANTKEKAYVAAQKADLRDLATAEESYFVDHKTYSMDFHEMNYTPTRTVVIAVTAASAEGWTANASHPGTAITCRVGFGSDSIAAVGDGVIQCR